MLRLHCLLEDREALHHGQPLQPRHELIDELADFVAVGDASGKDLDVVLPEQRLRLQVHVLDVEAALAELSLRVGPVSGHRHVVEVLLGEALRPLHRLLDTVLNLAV